MTGIYKITNLINNKCYIGKSIDIQDRWNQHKSPYEWGRQPNSPLYQSFIKYGLNNFSFEVIEECQPEELNKKEKEYIDFYKSLIKENGYNILSGGEGNYGENHPNHKVTKEDVIDIRTRYNNRERCKEVEKIYQSKIGHSGFSKIWKGETWSDIMPEVYTKENIDFHKHDTGQRGVENGRSLLKEEDVYEIRNRKKNGENWRIVYEDYKYTGIKPDCFYQTWAGYNWKHIQVI